MPAFSYLVGTNDGQVGDAHANQCVSIVVGNVFILPLLYIRLSKTVCRGASPHHHLCRGILWTSLSAGPFLCSPMHAVQMPFQRVLPLTAAAAPALSISLSLDQV